jgi:hypothetical protein
MQPSNAAIPQNKLPDDPIRLNFGTERTTAGPSAPLRMNGSGWGRGFPPIRKKEGEGMGRGSFWPVYFSL